MSDALPALGFFFFLLTFVLFAKQTKSFAVSFFLDDADSDEGEKDSGDGYELDAGRDRACDLRAGDEIGGNVYQDGVNAPEVANMFCLFRKSVRRQCALLHTIFFLFECSKFMLIVAQLHQGGGPKLSQGAGWIPSTRFHVSRAW